MDIMVRIPDDLARRLGTALGVKQQLAAVRMLFDWLITGHVRPWCSVTLA